ncbi:MAG: thioesterase family protein [Candidatus Eisenbacteria bacterium]
MKDGNDTRAGFVPVLYEDEKRGCTVCRQFLRVRYSETDRMSLAYNAHYLTWFELGRTELMRCSGMSYKEVEERGILLPLVEATLKLRAAIIYDDVIRVEAWISRIRSRAVSFSYAIYDGERLAAEGTTIHASVAAGSDATVVLPDWLRRHLIPLLPTRSV